MIKSGLALPPPLYLPVGVKSARTRSVAAGSALFLDGYPPNGAKIYDHSGNGYDGTITNATWVRQKSGVWTLKYGGTAYVELTAPLMNFTSGDFTIALWVKTTNLTGSTFLVTRGLYPTDGYYMHITNVGAVYLTTVQATGYQQSATNDNVVVVNQWYRLGVTRSGASVRVYKNGLDVTSIIGSHINPATCARTVKIGIYDDKVAGALIGSTGSVDAYPACLTPAQMLADYMRDKWLCS